ncbi:putative alpha-1,6-mannosyltransferase subunit (Hoc1) [Aspergillus saccharolyticus JOP 1030-1]|uniref:Alpha-1,6-mannosyltransferase subunit n=1 Tax=Aspergillus saccharolyticus JOP 1030-1 TaxID=1450539 RepID=A0A318Z8U2_9EURO|nr:hypothetical protein BP01DRAFT_393102 [Aspergillus saccharolyticus JOP 1030-1]PYH43765.1 hypothetical protein BP01DRAFT_393102 [Aspergillus saccharolyticus JOP 1030-1]
MPLPLRPLQLLQAVLAVCVFVALFHSGRTTTQQVEQRPAFEQKLAHHLHLPPEPEPEPESAQKLEHEERDMIIPRTIHHLLLAMPNHPVTSFHPTAHTLSWLHSGWKVEYWSEEACVQLAREVDAEGRYAAVLRGLPSAVLVSDFCRYLILLVRGGVYNDLDVRLVRELPWEVMFHSPGFGEEVEEEEEGGSRGLSDGPPRAKEMEMEMEMASPPAVIIGLEGDTSTPGLPRPPQFVQWTMVAAPGHPIFAGVLRRIVETTEEYTRQAAHNPAAVAPDIMAWTGPGVWTEAVLEYLDVDEGMLHTLRNLQHTIRIKDVVVLPKRGFAITQGEDHSSPEVLVKHYFAGTWKTAECRVWWRWVGWC